MRIRRAFAIINLATLFAAVMPASPAIAADPVYDYMTGTRGTRLWIPPGLQTVKGILIYGNGAGGDSRDEVFRPWYQQFAELFGFAIVGTSQWSNLSGSEIATWDAHLQALATASGHPELVRAPWAPIGFSNGGQMSYGFNALRPEKTIAFITNKGGGYNVALPTAASLATPGILIAGELDTDLRRNNIRALFDDNRPRGALWSWVEQQGEAHSGRADELVLPFMAEAIRVRYPAGAAPTATTGVTLLPTNPADEWLADQSSWRGGMTAIAPRASYAGDPQLAGSLMNENVAYLYRAFSTYDIDVVLKFADDPFAYVEAAPEGATSVRLVVDVTLVPDWTKIEILNYAGLLTEATPAGQAGDGHVAMDVPLTGAGVYGLSALVTHGDGVTISTSNLVALTAIPEPATPATVAAAAGVVLLGRRVCRSKGRSEENTPPIACSLIRAGS